VSAEFPEQALTETLIVRCPRQLQVIFLLFGAASAAYLACSWRHIDLPIPVEGEFLILAVIFVVTSVYALYTLNDRIEITEKEIAFYRGQTMIRRSSVRDIQEIRLSLGRKVLLFADGEKFSLQDQWVNAAVAVAFFQTLLDARKAGRQSELRTASLFTSPGDASSSATGEAHSMLKPAAKVDSRTVTLPLQYVTVPPQCVGCGRPPTTTCDIIAARGIDLILFAWHTTAVVPLPACGGCRSTRRIAGVVSFMFIIAAIVGWIALFVSFEGLMGRETGMFLMLGGFISMVWFSRNRLDRVLDRLVLGVSTVRISKDAQDVTLRFRNAEVAARVTALTTQRREEMVRSGKRILGEPEL